MIGDILIFVAMVLFIGFALAMSAWCWMAVASRWGKAPEPTVTLDEMLNGRTHDE